MTSQATEHDDRPETLLDSMSRRIGILELDLGGRAVVTEAATGAYATTAVIAALAGAKVNACARDTASHGTAREAIEATRALARLAGVEDRITFSFGVPDEVLWRCDILTNSGRIRPITATHVRLMPKSAVIALMFEAWEFRDGDIDRNACRDRGIRIVAVNERHPDVAVFPFLGPLCVLQLSEAGLDVPGCAVAVLCDNPFAPHLLEGLDHAGARATLFLNPEALSAGPWHAVVLALTPDGAPLGAADLSAIAARAPGALVTQFWGDVDRKAASALAIRIAPSTAPAAGHMGILLNRLGHEPIVRLQAGGLKAAEIVLSGRELESGGIAELVT